MQTRFEVRNVSAAVLRKDMADTCVGMYEVELAIGEGGGVVLPGWCVAGVNLEGEWVHSDGDDMLSGRVRVRDGLRLFEIKYDTPILIGADEVDQIEVTPRMVPEWFALVDQITEDADGYDEAVQAALDKRTSIVERIEKALEYSVVCPEPDAHDVYEALSEFPGMEALNVRHGEYLGAGYCIAWINTKQQHEYEWNPTNVPTRLWAILAELTAEVIRYNIEGNHEAS